MAVLPFSVMLPFERRPLARPVLAELSVTLSSAPSATVMGPPIVLFAVETPNTWAAVSVAVTFTVTLPLWKVRFSAAAADLSSQMPKTCVKPLPALVFTVRVPSPMNVTLSAFVILIPTQTLPTPPIGALVVTVLVPVSLTVRS